MSASGPEPRTRSQLGPLGEILLVWSLSFAAIVAASIFVGSQAKLVATFGFLYLPLPFMRRRDEDYRDYGITLRSWKRDLLWFSVLCAVVFPLFVGAYVVFVSGMKSGAVPGWLLPYLTPFQRAHALRPQLPPRFAEWLVDALLVVALPEEFFYRGYIQKRLRAVWPQGRTLWGVRLGPAFWVTAVLFALGHLAILKPWRLAVFFPALLFGWLRGKTGTVLASTLFHAACNLLMLMLETAYFR